MRVDRDGNVISLRHAGAIVGGSWPMTEDEALELRDSLSGVIAAARSGGDRDPCQAGGPHAEYVTERGGVSCRRCGMRWMSHAAWTEHERASSPAVLRPPESPAERPHYLLLVEGDPEPALDGPFLPDDATALAAAKRGEAFHGKRVRLFRSIYVTPRDVGGEAPCTPAS